MEEICKTDSEIDDTVTQISPSPRVIGEMRERVGNKMQKHNTKAFIISEQCMKITKWTAFIGTKDCR